MAIVVVAHSAIAYMVTPIGWAIQDPCRSLAADLFVWCARGMVMPLFFWLAGYFSREVFQRGVLAFVRQRLTRILVPLAIAIVPMSYVLDALWDWGREVGGRGAVPGHVPGITGSHHTLTLGHLWFLYYLLAMSAVALVVVPLARKIRLAIPPAIAGALSIVPIAIAGTLGLETPLGFVIDPAVLAYEGAFFAWGWLVHARPDELPRAANRCWVALALAVVALALVIPTLRTGGDVPAYAIGASGAFSLLLVDATIGLCVRIGSQPRGWVRKASTASFAIYIVHLPIVVLLQILVASRGS